MQEALHLVAVVSRCVKCERAVDLDRRQGQALEERQRGVARPEIVDGDFDAAFLQDAENVHRPLDVLAHRFLRRLDMQESVDIAVFHDDQHGTAAVVLAALVNACRLTSLRLSDLRIGQIGLGAAGMAIALTLMRHTGQPVRGADKARKALERLRLAGGMPSDLDEVMGTCDVVIATTGEPGLIKAKAVRRGQVIFALSNPRPEIDAQEAIAGGAIVAENGAQINNLLCYPVSVAAFSIRARSGVFLNASWRRARR